MINSRKIYDLVTDVAARCVVHKSRVEMELGCELLITSTYRDFEAQDALYAQGRTTPGLVVTNARGGDSFHNYRVAYDVVPIVAGKPVWQASDPIWQEVGRIGRECGLEWGGDWKLFTEFPHFQFTGGRSIEDFKSTRRV